MADTTISHMLWLEKLERRELGTWPKATQRILVETRLDLRQSDPTIPSGIRAVLCVHRDFHVAEREPDLGQHLSSATTRAVTFLRLHVFIRA